METAHLLMVWVEKVLDQQETFLGIYLDIEGAFNYTSFDTIYAASVRQGIGYAIFWWIRDLWRAVAIHKGLFMRVVV
jgi:hypothetical protein